MTVIAWTYMVEAEDGLTKQQINNLLKLIPEDVEVIPFTNDVVKNENALLEANSVAIGFIHNNYYEEMEKVQETLATVCNDWDNERKDNTYSIKDTSDLKTIMLCDSETLS